jgi:predicted DNA-binding transcriptional regulator YafY
MSKLSHLLEMIVTLQYKPLTSASELAEILGVDKKTIYRYIGSLNEANIPVHTKKGRYGGFYIDKEFCMKSNNLNWDELNAVIMASELLTKERGFNYEIELKKAVSKIKSVEFNCNMELQHMKEDKGFIMNHIGCMESLDDNIAKINHAMQKGRTVSITYFSINKSSMVVHKVDPYTLMFYKGAWHLIGYSYLLNCVETFKLSRVKKIKLTTEIYMKPATFSLEEYLEKNKGIFKAGQTEVKVKFTGSAVAFIKNNSWYDDQQIDEMEDGSIVLKFLTNELKDTKSWVMGFGTEAEIVQPEKLRYDIINDIETLSKIYKKYPDEMNNLNEKCQY